MPLPPFFDSNNCESDLAKRILHIRFQILVYSPNFTKKILVYSLDSIKEKRFYVKTTTKTTCISYFYCTFV